MTEQAFATPQEALAHFGVKGMKWGVRNVDRSSGSKPKRPVNQARVDRINAKADETQKVIDNILAKPSKWRYVQKQNDAQVAELTKVRDRQRKAAKDISEGRRLTDSQRKAVRNAAIVGAVLAAYGTYKFVDSGQANQAAINLAAKRSKNPFAWKKNADLAKQMDADGLFSNVVKKINPDYGGVGTKMNCRRCTFAYEMNRRGFDVKATKSISGTGQTPLSVVNATTPGSKLPTGRWSIISKFAQGKIDQSHLDVISNSTWGKNSIGIPDANSTSSTSVASKIFSSLANEPNGARGELGVGWGFGGGHSMAWEIVNGKPVIFDTQNSTMFSSPDSFSKLAGNIKSAGYTRLDNLDMNNEYLKRWLQNAG